MTPVKYYTHIQLGSDSKTLRYQLIRFALQNGIKVAARVFHTTPKTVRKWVSRWRMNPDQGLIDRRKIRTTRPARISPVEREKAIRLKLEHPYWGALKIKREFGLSISDKAIRKIWKEGDLELQSSNRREYHDL
jgi:transposase